MFSIIEIVVCFLEVVGFVPTYYFVTFVAGTDDKMRVYCYTIKIKILGNYIRLEK